MYPPPSTAPGQSVAGGITATSSIKASSGSSSSSGAGSRAPGGVQPSKQQATLGGASPAARRSGLPLAPLLGLGGGVAAVGFLAAYLLRRRSHVAQRDTKAGATQTAGVANAKYITIFTFVM